MKRLMSAVSVMLLVMLLCGCSALKGGPKDTGEYTDIAILTTTDMHGKCWEKNLVTDADVRSNMLRVSDAVSKIRDEYGRENVILLDNGDAFQGTMISQMHLSADSWDPDKLSCQRRVADEKTGRGQAERMDT